MKCCLTFTSRCDSTNLRGGQFSSSHMRHGTANLIYAAHVVNITISRLLSIDVKFK
jgi:hypothetical protein